MANNAYYFSHDSNAKDDPKCMLLIDQLGLEGYGIFWVLIEVLRDQPDYKYPLNLIPILARRYNTTAEKMNTVVKNYRLFDFDEKNNFFSISLNRRMDKVQIGIEQRRLAGLASGEKRRNKLLRTTIERPLNECRTKKRKEKKGNEKKEDYFIQQFDIFRLRYKGTKRGLDTEYADFIKKNDANVVELLLPALEKEIAYKQRLVDAKKFCPEWKNLKTWINQKCWEQEFEPTEEPTIIFNAEPKQVITEF